MDVLALRGAQLRYATPKGDLRDQLSDYLEIKIGEDGDQPYR
jgi:hypothetical protein